MVNLEAPSQMAKRSSDVSGMYRMWCEVNSICWFLHLGSSALFFRKCLQDSTVRITKYIQIYLYYPGKRPQTLLWVKLGQGHIIMRAHIWEHRGEHTYESTEEANRFQDREAHFVRAQEPVSVEIHRKNAGPQAHVWKFTGKCCIPFPGTAFRASLRNRNAHGHFKKAILCDKFQEKCQIL